MVEHPDGSVTLTAAELRSVALFMELPTSLLRRTLLTNGNALTVQALERVCEQHWVLMAAERTGAPQ